MQIKINSKYLNFISKTFKQHHKEDMETIFDIVVKELLTDNLKYPNKALIEYKSGDLTLESEIEIVTDYNKVALLNGEVEIETFKYTDKTPELYWKEGRQYLTEGGYIGIFSHIKEYDNCDVSVFLTFEILGKDINLSYDYYNRRFEGEYILDILAERQDFPKLKTELFKIKEIYENRDGQ